MLAHDIIIRPIITEDSMDRTANKVYTFKVASGATKPEVKKAVEEIFKVNVVSVNIVNVRRKARRVGKYEGFRPAVKKAVVTVAEGQTIDAFEI